MRNPDHRRVKQRMRKTRGHQNLNSGSKAKKTMIPINKVVPVLPDGDDDDDEFQDCMASPTKIALAQPKPRSPKEVIIIMFIMCSVVAIRDRAGEFCGPRKVNGNHSIGIHEAVAI